MRVRDNVVVTRSRRAEPDVMRHGKAKVAIAVGGIGSP